MWGMQKFRHYLLGRKFFLRVDHKPLVAMLRNKLNWMTEAWVDNILEYSFVTIYVPGKENQVADTLSRQFETFEQKAVNVVGGNLSPEEQTQVLLMEAERRNKKIPTKAERKQLLQQAHSIGHLSVEGTFRQVWEEGYWWPLIRQDIQAMVNKCMGCLRFNVHREGYHPLKSIEAEHPWDHIEIDLIGPLEADSYNMKWILTITDVLSGYTVLRSLVSKEDTEVSRALWGFICEYGTPKIIQSDNGTEFTNQVLREMTQLFGIDHRFITAYHPRADGLVERMNKEVARRLKKEVNGS